MRIHQRQTAIVAGLLLLAIGLSDRASAQEAESHQAEALQVTTAAAMNYQFELAGDSPRELTLRRGAILRWSNPVAGEVFGNVFLWTHKGRPEVIGSLFQWYSPFTHGSHEFHSLATGAVRGSRDGQQVWDSKLPGIALRRVEDEAEVADQQVTRLRRMRAISRKFTAQKTDREGVTRDLRLLPQPIYRYPAGNSTVLDGALFVFVQGTDPEVFLLVEARKSSEDWEWQYALARMNGVQFVAKYQGRKVWSVETWPWSQVKNGSEPYTSFGPFNRPGGD